MKKGEFSAKPYDQTIRLFKCYTKKDKRKLERFVIVRTGTYLKWKGHDYISDLKIAALGFIAYELFPFKVLCTISCCFLFFLFVLFFSKFQIHVIISIIHHNNVGYNPGIYACDLYFTVR